jgi:putative SOS response-associated peptidase YedK
MIKRYSITLSKNLLSKQFSATVDANYQAIYNAGPGQKLPVITSDNPHRVHLFQWGILPFDSVESGASEKLINARAKTLFAKEPFCNLIESKRCIIPADSFYVWKEQFNVSTPYRVLSALENTFSIAGVWDQWQVGDGETMFGSFTMITRESTPEILEYSERMPLILNESEANIWLNDRVSEDFIHQLLAEPNGIKLKVYKVTNLVNNLANNSRKVIKEVNATLPGETLSLFGF